MKPSLHPLQHPNRRRLLLLAYMAIGVHCQPDITMPRQGLGRLGRHIRPAEVRVPHGVEIGIEALGVLVSEEIGILSSLAFFVSPEYMC